MFKSFYHDLLWADHPLWALHKIRGFLFSSQSASNHDWGALVAYEALPDDFERQLMGFQYRQAKAALDAAVNQIDVLIDRLIEGDNGIDFEEFDNQALSTLNDIDKARERLPAKGYYEAESFGLHGSTLKRTAELSFHRKNVGAEKALAPDCYKDPIKILKQSRTLYTKALNVYVLQQNDSTQKVASLHWLGIQVLSLNMILGDPFDQGLYSTIEYFISRQLKTATGDQESRAWLHGTMAEAKLLRYCIIAGNEEVSQKQASRYKEEVRQHLDQLVELFPDPGRHSQLFNMQTTEKISGLVGRRSVRSSGSQT